MGIHVVYVNRIIRAYRAYHAYHTGAAGLGHHDRNLKRIRLDTTRTRDQSKMQGHRRLLCLRMTGYPACRTAFSGNEEMTCTVLQASSPLLSYLSILLGTDSSMDRIYPVVMRCVLG